MTASPWEHFTVEELACRHCGKMFMNADFMEKLVRLRKLFNAPMPINSGYRCSEYNKQVGGTGPAHEGRAVDVRVSGAEALRLVDCALKLKLFTGIGISQKLGSDYLSRFIHLDDMTPQEMSTRPFLWSY